ncbi:MULTISPECIES: hypothetical protein [unclassified Bacillus (in: firmicutes)]|uniref:hypothetical protein n=1 Tax=unclassified Bacillus (in: firmicutes) TaxID=185979 RepID=UPI0037C0ADFA
MFPLMYHSLHASAVESGLTTFCLGRTVVAVQFSTFTNINSASMGMAATLFNVQNRIGSAIGVAILASILGKWALAR